MFQTQYRAEIEEHTRNVEDLGRIDTKARIIEERKTLMQRDEEQYKAIKNCHYDMEPLEKQRPSIDKENFKIRLI